VRITPCDIPEVLLLDPDVYRDARGFFLETFHAEKYRALGIGAVFVQDNQSKSVRGTVRGLHLQVRRPQAKLIRVIHGEIFDVAVDVRRGSPTFGRAVSVMLSADNSRQCYVPAGFAHGFAVTSDTAEIEYKCSTFYDPADELVIAWDDPALAISWPIERPILSARDANAPALAAVTRSLPTYANTDL
jgi:dTDP-4-dehydrorhamnose 3,5-epimerase